MDEQAYSMDIRDRVVGAVEKKGLSRRRSAAWFGVSYSVAIIWMKRFRETGSAAPGHMGGHKPRKIAGSHRDWRVERCRGGDFTMRGLVASWVGEA